MKFGKLEQVDDVDFSLPTPTFFVPEKHRPDNLKAHLLLGGTGWSHKHWNGSLYPIKTKSGEFLNAYGRQFNSIELNTTHYRIPPADMVLKWANQVPDDFKFAPKILQYISHSRLLGVDTDRIERFCASIRHFKHKLGPSFLQLPPHFSPEKLGVLESFLEAWPTDLALSVELRHPDWFAGCPEMELLLGMLTDLNIGLVITDVAGRRDVAHNYFTSDHCILRFGGNYPHPSDENRLLNWAKIIQQYFDHGMDAFYFFSHEINANAPGIVRDLQQIEALLSQNIEVNTRHPKIIAAPQTLF